MNNGTRDIPVYRYVDIPRRIRGKDLHDNPRLTSQRGNGYYKTFVTIGQ